jgi:hypothetical protein
MLLALGVLVCTAPSARANAAADADPDAGTPTPPRLSLVEGRVSFWRPGADDWVEAQVNTPLAPGDELAIGAPGGVELQVGARAFVRGAAETQVGLEDHEPGFLQVKVTAGGVALDLRELDANQSVEVNTPSAAFTIEHPGYYRVDVAGARTSFITRRGGRATAIPAAGEAVAIGPGSHVVVEGVDEPRLATFAAPQSDDWDRWNYARSKELLQARSARHVAPGTYGLRDLDEHGAWRTVPTYGTVWVPSGMPAGWAPYTTGAWTLDPVYGWTWVDAAPWGWAPYHHGRWVYVDGYWAWAPGPVVRRAVYAPALVAFLGGVGLTVGAGPAVAWVALGWGEPLVPWWGRPGFIHVPSWRGWGGPRFVNNVAVSRTTVVHVHTINVYRNARVRHAVMVVEPERFGRGRITGASRAASIDASVLRPVHTGPHVVPTRASFAPSTARGIRPPEDHFRRRVVATRSPRQSPSALDAHDERPRPRVVSAPSREAPSRIPSAAGTAARDGGKAVVPPRREGAGLATRDPARPPVGDRERDKPGKPAGPANPAARELAEPGKRAFAPPPPRPDRGKPPAASGQAAPVPARGDGEVGPGHQARPVHPAPREAPAQRAEPPAPGASATRRDRGPQPGEGASIAPRPRTTAEADGDRGRSPVLRAGERPERPAAPPAMPPTAAGPREHPRFEGKREVGDEAGKGQGERGRR